MEAEQTHTDAKYETSDVDVTEFVPDGFTHDETIDFSRKVNYIFEDESGNVFRVTVGKDTILFDVSFYANNKDKGHSASKPVLERDEMMKVRNNVLETVDLN